MSAMLYLVPTPIGNLSDISERCREVLAQADFIAAEDTRVTLRLLNHLELKKPLVSYYEHNKAASGPRIVERILAGETCALVSDAGSPAISDPGEDLVRLCAEAGVTVSAIPGPCAAITGLRSLSFASADELREILWLETGAVTPLALLNAPDVTLYLDEALLGSRIAVHPNTNTATVWLQTADLVSLLHARGVPVTVVPFPCLA